MKKTIKNSLKIVACLFIFISCDDYLDIQPEDKFLEETVFASEESIQNVINGIYMEMTKGNTYGGHLTMSTVDVLAQRYYAYSDDSKYYDLAHYEYGQTNVKNTIDNIWSSMYVIILNINKTIENLDINEANIPMERLNVLKGEIVGLRAMLHFDLLRLFGPIYSVDSASESIPYYNSATTDINPLLPASKVIEMVLADLEIATGLLSDDPVRTSGKYNASAFYGNRDLRFNYYSAKAIQARVLLYAGNNSEANVAAKEVIKEGMQWFEWVNPDDVISAGDNPDRIFSSEVIFAVQNVNIYDRHDDFFNSNIEDDYILAPEPLRLDQTFEGNLNDYRYSPSWKVPTDATKTYKTFLKFEDVVEKEMNFRFMQPLVRMSEMYYIVAETEIDITVATDYLNVVREHRGLPNLDSGLIDLPLELMKEYKREFYGEGQLFYYYKRNNMSVIEDGSDSVGDVVMDESTYILPLPESETDYRQE